MAGIKATEKCLREQSYGKLLSVLRRVIKTDRFGLSRPMVPALGSVVGENHQSDPGGLLSATPGTQRRAGTSSLRQVPEGLFLGIIILPGMLLGSGEGGASNKSYLAGGLATLYWVLDVPVSYCKRSWSIRRDPLGQSTRSRLASLCWSGRWTYGARFPFAGLGGTAWWHLCRLSACILFPCWDTNPLTTWVGSLFATFGTLEELIQLSEPVFPGVFQGLKSLLLYKSDFFFFFLTARR